MRVGEGINQNPLYIAIIQRCDVTIPVADQLPCHFISVIVNPLILRAGCNSPPAVNQAYIPYTCWKPASAHGWFASNNGWFFPREVSRSGVIPEPTVRVRMGESNDTCRV